jgi:hypothetical protein
MVEGERGGCGTALRRTAGFLLAALVLCLSAAPETVRGGEQTGPTAASFTPIVAAWKARDAETTAAAVPEKDGRLDVSLFGAGDGKVAGRYTRKTAETELGKYFAGLDKASLTDVTPSSTPRSATRTYDYTYRPKGGESKTTRLAITLADDGDGKWWFAKVAESARPR